MLISFGKKIELGKCYITDRAKNEPVQASLIKFDCKDRSDSALIKNLGSSWKFNHSIADKMLDVYYRQRDTESPYEFYAIETQNGEIVGIAQTKNLGREMILDLIESEREKKYKYVGKNMISFLCAEALKKGKESIYIPNPVLNAREFYTKKCGFKITKNEPSMELNKFGMKRALKTTPIDYFA